MEVNYKKLISKYIDNEIENLLLYIHKSYPNIIKKKDLKYLLKKYCKTSSKEYNKYNDKEKKIICFKVKKKIFNRKFLNNNMSITKKERKTNFKFDNKKCKARIWGNGNIIKLENGTIIYGKQCGRNKNGSLEYCKQHIKNNPHDDFNKEPSEKLKKHYHKYKKNL